MTKEIFHHIFLSYSRRDTPFMQQVRDALLTNALQVWTDENLEPGSRAWETAIARAIRAAGCLVVILTPDSEQSEWVGRELAYAETLNVRIFPILARGDERDAVPFRLISHQWIDARTDYERALRTLIASVKHYTQDFAVVPRAMDRPTGVTGTLHPPLHPTEPPADVAVEVKPLWMFQTSGEVRGSPVVFNNGVFFGSSDRQLYALQLKTGKPVWRFTTKGAITGSPLVSESRQQILFGAEDSFFYALDCRSGKATWSFLANSPIQGTPAIALDRVFFGSDDGNLYALALANGRLQRSYPTFSPVRTRPLITDDLVIFGLENGELQAMELSGTRKWNYRTRGRIFASPTSNADHSACYFGSTDGYAYGLDTKMGWVLWRFRTGGSIISSPLFSEGTLYFGSGDGKVYALTAANGTQKWEFKTSKAVSAAPVLWHNRLYIGSTDGTFYCLDARTGKEIWHYAIGAPVLGAACIAGETVLVGATDGTLYALQA
ncbi:MAG: toll/interleukin-1 receptor domain-containing protein [Anaerolineae bacterium]|nr:toll/interleukin-1 receptor domain-containing protein [Anaerolineae bacterium]